MGFPIGGAAGELELRALALPPSPSASFGLLKALPQSSALGETSETFWPAAIFRSESEASLFYGAHAGDGVERAHGGGGFVGVEDLAAMQVQLQAHTT